MIKTYKYKLEPNHAQALMLSHWLGVTRFIYNLCLDYRIQAYRANGASISKSQLQKELKEIKNETDWMQSVHSQVIQGVTDRLDKAYDNFAIRGYYTHRDFSNTLCAGDKAVEQLKKEGLIGGV